MPIASARPCQSQAVGQQEAAFLETLRAVQRFEIAEDGALVLVAAGDGGTITRATPAGADAVGDRGPGTGYRVRGTGYRVRHVHCHLQPKSTSVLDLSTYLISPQSSVLLAVSSA